MHACYIFRGTFFVHTVKKWLLWERKQPPCSTTPPKYSWSRTNTSIWSFSDDTLQQAKFSPQEEIYSLARSLIGRTQITIGHQLGQRDADATSTPMCYEQQACYRQPHATSGGRYWTPTDGPTCDSDQIFLPPPQPLVESHGGQSLVVDLILIHCGTKGQHASYSPFMTLRASSKMMLNVNCLVRDDVGCWLPSRLVRQAQLIIPTAHQRISARDAGRKIAS